MNNIPISVDIFKQKIKLNCIFIKHLKMLAALKLIISNLFWHSEIANIENTLMLLAKYIKNAIS